MDSVANPEKVFNYSLSRWRSWEGFYEHPGDGTFLPICAISEGSQHGTRHSPGRYPKPLRSLFPNGRSGSAQSRCRKPELDAERCVAEEPETWLVDRRGIPVVQVPDARPCGGHLHLWEVLTEDRYELRCTGGRMVCLEGFGTPGRRFSLVSSCPNDALTYGEYQAQSRILEWVL